MKDLKKLYQLEISNNKVHYVSLHCSLQMIHVFQYIQFYGVVDWDIIASLISLKYLSIAGNNFIGSVSMSKPGKTLPQTLEYFELGDNLFNGSVEWNIFSNMTGLWHLDLHQNNFNGPIIMSYLPSSLQDIVLDSNSFTGNILWDIFETFEYLVSIHLENNWLNGSISMSDGKTLPKFLQNFYVENNQFESIKWDIFRGLYDLSDIQLENNILEGTINWMIISELYYNGSLESLKLCGNRLSGYADFSWIKDDFKAIILTLDTSITCMYIPQQTF